MPLSFGSSQRPVSLATVDRFFASVISAIADVSSEDIARQAQVKRLISVDSGEDEINLHSEDAHKVQETQTENPANIPSKYSQILPRTQWGIASRGEILTSTKGDPKSKSSGELQFYQKQRGDQRQN